MYGKVLGVIISLYHATNIYRHARFCACFVKPLNAVNYDFQYRGIGKCSLAISGVTKFAFLTQLVHANNTINVSS